jgi:hypothetical protein
MLRASGNFLQLGRNMEMKWILFFASNPIAVCSFLRKSPWPLLRANIQNLMGQRVNEEVESL